MPKISPEKMQQRRQEIIDKAFEVFSAKGYTQASVDDIIKSMGISKGGLYTHFKSKEEIFLAIAEERFLLRSRLIADMDPASSATEKISRYIRWFLESLRQEAVCRGIRFTIEFWSVLSRDASKGDLARKRYAKFEKDLEEIMLAGIETGEFRQDLDSKSMVYLILSTLDGIGFTNAIMGIPATDAAIASYEAMILRHLIS